MKIVRMRVVSIVDVGKVVRAYGCEDGVMHETVNVDRMAEKSMK